MFEDVIGLLQKEERRHKQRERRREISRLKETELVEYFEEADTAEGRRSKRRAERPRRQWLLEDEL